MKAITIRGIDEELEKKLRTAARDNGDSINSTLLKLIRRGLGLDKRQPYQVFHDLDKLAGTWSERDEDEFKAVQAGFSTIDQGLWK